MIHPRIIGLIVGGVALLTAFLVILDTREADTAPDAPDIELIYFDGSVGHVADFRGTPVVLNFWASWCPACVAELPDFQEVHESLGDRVVFVGLNMQEIDRRSAEALIEQTGVTYLLADDPDGAIYRSLGGIAMPTTVILDAGGAVARVHAGVLFGDDLRALVEEVLATS
ncbi:MAG: TlpA disulfide reductase family protein [Acidimicrobiia bacterium]|jgi:cytochrome c biogenesis protein CcmG, thiol:disulfide interchange protein DsbE